MSDFGDEMIKKYYCQEKGINYQELPRKGTFRKSVEIKNCIAHYIEFQTPQLKEFLKRIKQGSLGMKDEFKESVKFYGKIHINS